MKDMCGREELCSLYDAREALLKSSAGSCFPKEIEIDIDNSINRILSRDIQKLLEIIRNDMEFKETVKKLGGYDIADMGKIVYPVRKT